MFTDILPVRCGGACQSIPSSCPLKAPRIKQRKRGPLLSLALSSFPMSLALLSPALCSSLSADAPTAAATLDGKEMSKGKPATGARQRTDDHSPEGAGLRPRRHASRKKFERAHPAFLLWSPPLSTRVIDGWGSFWPRLVHFALQRVPPSPSQTMHTRFGLITNEHSCRCQFYLLYLFICLFVCLFKRTNFFSNSIFAN